nr:phospholipase D-like domain-containing protein [Leptospira barantonii]
MPIVWILVCGSFCTNERDSKPFWLALTGFRNVETFFSYPGRYVPNLQKRNVREKVLRLIEDAKLSIDLWVYSFEDPEILDALIRANRRGVVIRIVADPEKEYPNEFVNLGMFRRWERSGLQHSKILMVDRKKVFLGSGNFTWYGLENDLNGYVSFELFDSEVEDFYSFLEEDPRITSLYIEPFEFYISPSKGRLIQNLLLRETDRAQFEIQYLIFDHFDSVLTSRLALADHKGVEVRGVYDSPVDAEGKYLAKVLKLPRSEILGDGNEETISSDSFGKGGLLHHKTMIADRKTLISGSYNFSVSARDNNREILFKTSDASVVDSYLKEWDRVRASAIPFRVDPFLQVEPNPQNQGSFYFGYAENSIPNGKEQIVCRIDSSKEDFLYLESGTAFWKSILEYSFSSGESCKNVSNFTATSSGFTGKKTNHPVKTQGFRKNGVARTKNGEILFSGNQSVGPNELDGFRTKPVHLFSPSYYSIQSGNVFFPEELSNVDSLHPSSILLYQKGNGPNPISWSQNGNYLSVTSNATEGIFFLEYESFYLSFCFHEYSKKGMEYAELIEEILSYRESELVPATHFESEKRPIQNRTDLGTYCYRY